MKKEYIKPSIEIAEFSSEVVMLSGSSINVGEGTFDSSEDDQYSNHRRGTWGNLWANDSK